MFVHPLNETLEIDVPSTETLGHQQTCSYKQAEISALIFSYK